MIIRQIAATFEQYWHEPEFETYDPHAGWRSPPSGIGRRESAWRGPDSIRLSINVEPKPFQGEILRRSKPSGIAGIFAI